MPVRRGVTLFADLPEPEKPVERLKPGQPGRAWRQAAPGFWIVDCKDGSRIGLNGARVVVLSPPRKSA